MKKSKCIKIIYAITLLSLLPVTGMCGYLWMSKCKMFESYIAQDNCGPDCTGTCVYVDVQGTGGECVNACFYNWCATVEQFYIPYEVQKRECIMQGEYPLTKCVASSVVLEIIEYYGDGYLCNCEG